MSAAVGHSRFWEDYQPGFRFTTEEVGTPEFFEAVAAHRYRLEPHIAEMVDFERWAGCDVLEVGCGIATDGARFAQSGAAYTGLDQSETARTIAEARFAALGLQGRFVEGDATALPFSDASFDLVFSHGVIHHIDATETAIAEIHRVLRPGGTALVMLYHRGSFNYWFTITVLRRLLAASLLVPGATKAVARITRERSTVLEGHRELLGRYGVRYLLDQSLFVSNNTDGPGNPLSKVYSRAHAARLFCRFGSVSTAVRFLNLRLYPCGERLARTRLARAAERRVGWHVYVRAVKSS